MKRTRVFQWFTSLEVSFSVGCWLKGKYRKLVFYDTNKPSFDLDIILDELVWGHQSPLIVAFCSGKSPGFVRESISKDGGLGELVEMLGVEWPGHAPHYLHSWPKLFICYRGTVDTWDLFKDAKRLEVS